MFFPQEVVEHIVMTLASSVPQRYPTILSLNLRQKYKCGQNALYNIYLRRSSTFYQQLRNIKIASIGGTVQCSPAILQKQLSPGHTYRSFTLSAMVRSAPCPMRTWTMS